MKVLDSNCIGEIFFNGKKLNQHNHNKGYKVINIKNKTFLTHRIIGEKYIINKSNKKTINHKDGDRKNNNIKNLEWATYSENNTHSYRILGKKSHMKNKPSPNRKKISIKNIETNEIKIFNSLTEASKYYNVGVTTINLWLSKIITKKYICKYEH